jgi:acetylornithine deacetylase/succinyl-diaminopimelate desuccinylase-like protein
MHDDLISKVDTLFPQLQAYLEALVRIPSVSANGFDPGNVRASANDVAARLTDVGFQDVRLLEMDGAHPAVFGEIPAPEGQPTVLLYAHHDVQPPGPDDIWDTPAFDPTTIDGRMYGRGSSDDKTGVIMHLGAILAHDKRPPVGVKVFIEGEEEIGSTHLLDFLNAYKEELRSDAIVIADAGTWAVGEPALTTSLRGLVDCEVTVSTLDAGVHSGIFGGVVPDSLTSLCRLLATLHDENGEVAVQGLVTFEEDGPDLSEADIRSQAGVIDGVDLIGSGSLTSRTWSKPAIAVLAMDAPPLNKAINQLLPSATAKVSMRLAPGQDPEPAMAALRDHLESNAPWGAKVTVVDGAAGDPYKLDTTGAAYDAFRTAFREVWGTDTIDMGSGGSIPFVAAFSEAYPDASILLTGAGDPTSRIHGPNESVDLDDLRRSVAAEAIALRLMAREL